MWLQVSHKLIVDFLQTYMFNILIFYLPGLCINNLTGHSNAIWALSLLPNGLIASGADENDSTIKIWDITKTYPLYTLTGHTNVIRALTVINNDYLASCSGDQTIKLWSLSSYSMIKSWTASPSWVLALAFDSTLNVLASGHYFKLVKVWDSSIYPALGKISSFLFHSYYIFRVQHRLVYAQMILLII